LVKNPETKKESYHSLPRYWRLPEPGRKAGQNCQIKTLTNAVMSWKTLNPIMKEIGLANEMMCLVIYSDDTGIKVIGQANLFLYDFYSNGLKTQRDAWCYNSSKCTLKQNTHTQIDFYNEQREAFSLELIKGKPTIKSFLTRDSKKLSWTRALEWDAEKNKHHNISDGSFVQAYYRPFYKQNLYFSRALNEMVYQIPKLFPNPSQNNLVICVSANYKDGSVLIVDQIPDLHFNGDHNAFHYTTTKNEQKTAPPFLMKQESQNISAEMVCQILFWSGRKDSMAKT
jgi:predicted helicase